MKLKNKKIGIWGFGKVGKSAVRYFYNQGNSIEVLDQRILSTEEKELLEKKQIPYFNNQNPSDFLERNDLIFPSPGIDLRSYKKFSAKWITEVSIIGQSFAKPLIAVTGSVGKTTVTHFLAQILQTLGVKLWTGGNIGTPMLDLLNEKKNFTMALLEVSSFQLEQRTHFSPDFAIWTNLYPNHLDRHENLSAYFQAKKNIINNQNKSQTALLSFSLIDSLKQRPESTLYFFSLKTPSTEEFQKLESQESLFYLKGKKIILRTCENKIKEKEITSIKNLEHITFDENLLIIFSAFYIIQQIYGICNTPSKITKKLRSIPYLEHRLEKVATISEIDFYNDSKSTTPESTISAVKRLSTKPIILLLGGISKGIDRTDLIKKIKNKVKIVYSFGKEASDISKICLNHNVSCYTFKTLNSAVKASIKKALPGDQILLSPAGTSFDLFKNYEHRGNCFKELIKTLKT